MSQVRALQSMCEGKEVICEDLRLGRAEGEPWSWGISDIYIDIIAIGGEYLEKRGRCRVDSDTFRD